ncbi:MAG: hypothetical protein WD757_03105 [Actinomycetota bacterium]
MTEILRLRPHEFAVSELHPGGGQYDCMHLEPMRTEGAPSIDINRAGSVHVQASDEGEGHRIENPWPILTEQSGVESMAAEVVSAVGSLKAAPTRPDVALACAETIADVLVPHVHGQWPLSCLMAWLDSSGYGGGMRESLLAPFNIQIDEPSFDGTNSIYLSEAYRSWVIARGDLPLVLVQFDGLVYGVDGSHTTLVGRPRSERLAACVELAHLADPTLV